MSSNFDKYPTVKVREDEKDCFIGWKSICTEINKQIAAIKSNRAVVVVDCYHGVLHSEVEQALRDGLSRRARMEALRRSWMKPRFACSRCGRSPKTF